MKPVKLDYRMTEQGFLEPILEVSNHQVDIGKYGRKAMNYLKEEHPYRFSLLRAEGILMETMYKVNQEAHQMMQLLQEQMLETEPIPNPENFYESYKHREMIRTRAEEMVLQQIVYQPR
uniref:TnpV protein n=1 Tax=Maledivibacter halophilus TaxID=36842 RepID=UPI0038BCFA85